MSNFEASIYGLLIAVAASFIGFQVGIDAAMDYRTLALDAVAGWEECVDIAQQWKEKAQ